MNKGNKVSNDNIGGLIKIVCSSSFPPQWVFFFILGWSMVCDDDGVKERCVNIQNQVTHRRGQVVDKFLETSGLGQQVSYNENFG